MINLDGIKVLVVDDEPFMRMTIKMALRALARFVVMEADDGDVAITMADTLKPGVVLCDLTMPRMGGLRFVELLRKHPAAHMRNMPVIILTGHAEEATVIAATKLQISGYLIKPVSTKHLNHHLQIVFGPSAGCDVAASVG